MRTLLIGMVAAAAATIFTPAANADPPCNNQACLSKPFSQAGVPFIGHWVAHEEGVTVNPDGTGTETYPDRSTCPNAPMAGCGKTGTVNFTLGSVMQGSSGAWDTAYGYVTSGTLQRGSFVTIQLVDNGNGMAFSTGGGDTMFPFCKIINNTKANSYDCGA